MRTSEREWEDSTGERLSRQSNSDLRHNIKCVIGLSEMTKSNDYDDVKYDLGASMAT